MLELPYVLCDACLDGDCDHCDGFDETEPFCGHRCAFLEEIDE